MQSAIARGKRIRKIGTKIPPPFPNGWFKVAESADLKCGQAQSVDILGRYTLYMLTLSHTVKPLQQLLKHF